MNMIPTPKNCNLTKHSAIIFKNLYYYFLPRQIDTILFYDNKRHKYIIAIWDRNTEIKYQKIIKKFFNSYDYINIFEDLLTDYKQLMHSFDFSDPKSVGEVKCGVCFKNKIAHGCPKCEKYVCYNCSNEFCDGNLDLTCPYSDCKYKDYSVMIHVEMD